MSKIIVHIDLNTFFVRCEEIRNPFLVGKCVAIGHEGRCGIVSTCSYEARKYGVHSGQPMFEAKKLCKDLIVIPDDFAYYHVLSKQFFDFVKRHTEIVEPMSVDECFADFTNVLKGNKDPISYFKKFQEDLFKETKLKCSIGISTTKYMAKMASDFKKPMGLTVIRRKDIPSMIYPLPIEDMLFIGKKTSPRLKAMGIKTIGDFKEKLDSEGEKFTEVIGNLYYAAKEWLSGFGDDKVITESWDPKSIGHSSTFSHDTDNENEIRDMFYTLSQEVSARAVKHRKIGQTIQITVKTNEFKSFNKSFTFKTPTNNPKKIFETAFELYMTNFKGLLLRLVGVTLQNLSNPKDISIQMTLFDYEKHEEENQTRLIINELNRKLKKPLLMRASEIEKKN